MLIPNGELCLHNMYLKCQKVFQLVYTNVVI